MCETNVKEELQYSKETINDDLRGHAPLWYWYSCQLTGLKKAVSVLQLQIEVFEADVCKKYRLRQIAEGKKSREVTERLLNEELKTNPTWRVLQNELIKAKHNERTYSTIVSAFTQRKDTLISFVSLLRTEANHHI